MGEQRPWVASYEEGVPASVAPFPEGSVFDMLSRSAERFPDRAAIAFYGKHLTYRRLMGEAERLSAALAELGVVRGDRVALVLPNCPQYVIAFYAIARLGAVVVGNNPLYTPAELAHQLKDCGAEVAVVLDQLYPTLAEVREEAGIRKVLATRITDYMRFPLNVLAPIKLRKEAKHAGKPWPGVRKGADVVWWKRAMKRAPSPPPAARVDATGEAAGFIYTGGTTGPAKGAMLSHRNMVVNAMQASAWFPALTPGEEAVMCVLPFFHSYCMTVGLNLGVLLGAKLILVPRFELHMVLRQVQKEKPTLFPGVPRLYVSINDAPESAKYDLRSIKACLSGAAPLPVSVADRFGQLTGARLREGYGLTECSPVTHANPIQGKAKAGSIGLPIPDTDCRVVALDEPDRVLGPGEVGEILVKGPQVMLGYWNRPDESAAMIRSGWLHTGDIGKMDEEGYFFVVDRMKEMIIVSGFNVYPSEIEKVMAAHPKIAKVCVAGVPDEKTGEAVKAFVVLKEGEAATAEDIVQWCRTELSGYHVPKQVEFRDSLPETLIGKVLRRVLQEDERRKASAGAGSAAT